jgi:glutaconate CoA-transferase subunit B
MKCSTDELIITSLARLLQGARHVAVGSASGPPCAAAWLVNLQSGGRTRIAVLGSPKAFFTDGGRELFDCAARGRIDTFFLSGGQIDGEANINLMGIGKYPDLGVRWAGTYGSPYLYSIAKRTILFREEHTRRVLVPRVDFISAAGTNEANVYRSGGPTALVTSRCVFSFDPSRRRFRLESVHPGHDVDEVRANTGFDFEISEGDVPVTPEPDLPTLELLRTSVPPLLAETYPQYARQVFGYAPAEDVSAARL